MNYDFNAANQNSENNIKEDISAGIAGAFIFALSGGILWFILYRLGYIVGICGTVSIIFAIKGYKKFGKKLSKAEIIASVTVSVAVIIIAWYFSIATDIFIGSNELYANGEFDFPTTFFESLYLGLFYLTDTGYLTDLGICLAFCALGGIYEIKKALTKIKSENSAKPETQPQNPYLQNNDYNLNDYEN